MNQKTAKKLRRFAKQRMSTEQSEDVFYKRSKRKYKSSDKNKKIIINQMLNYETSLHK